jgi:D-glycero-alpha-D-manno-heptose 1-phosphate guanylyltransferase
MIKKAVILAGGKGTRLASVVQDKPKPMAEITGLPFLHYMILDLKKKGISEVVLLVGHLKEVLMDYFKDSYHGVRINYEIETEPRGTGGLIYELAKKWNESILLINGDTYFDVDIQTMALSGLEGEIILAVKKIENSDRYGALTIVNEKIIDFQEKSRIDSGFINGGIYFMPKGCFDTFDLPFSFSLEKDFFELNKHTLSLKPFYSDGYFIDIGIPEDYSLAQLAIPRQFIPKIDNTWSLFLDRDGVINEHRPEDYVKNESEFVWINGSKEAIRELSKIFGRIIVVTNQQGIGKGLMSEYDLEKIHWKMQNDIENIDGKIDRVYYCPHLAHVKPKCRKPETGMAEQAKSDFPEIDFNKSFMVGDSCSDIEFGKRLGMNTVKVGIEHKNCGEILKVRSLSELSLLILNP